MVTKSGEISGFVKPGFEAVQEAFAENFERRKELRAACCVYCRGKKVVDLWGGIRNKDTGEPWEEDTIVIIASATKRALSPSEKDSSQGASEPFFRDVFKFERVAHKPL